MTDISNFNGQHNSSLDSMIGSHAICDFCLGRLSHGFDTVDELKQNGKRIRKQSEVRPDKCELCDGIVNEIAMFVDLIIEAVKSYEFSTFVLGFHVDPILIERENQIIDTCNIETYVSLKDFLKKYIGSIVEKKLDKKVSFDHADIMIVFNTMFNVVDLQVKPLFVYGRYNKYKRGIPQSKWFCRQCRGIGCRDCSYTGSLYETSVEELIRKSFIHHTDGEKVLFHGSGREDVDVKMLGSGRPFVIEILNPKKRCVDLERICNEINRANNDLIAVNNLKMTNRNAIVRIKESKFRKVYNVTFEGEQHFNTEKLKKAALFLRDAIIQQLTPTRVARRRANKVREKKIYDCSVVSVKDNRASFRIESSSGTYIKELVTGDNGRTNPNISDLIGQPCKVVSLDVMEIKGE